MQHMRKGILVLRTIHLRYVTIHRKKYARVVAEAHSTLSPQLNHTQHTHKHK